MEEYEYLMELLDIGHDSVYNPAHYTDGKIKVKDFINDKNLNFNRGNIVKYISRAGKAGKKDAAKEVEDIEKVIQYANFEIIRLTGRQSSFKLQAVREFLISAVKLFDERMDENTTAHDLLEAIILFSLTGGKKIKRPN